MKAAIKADISRPEIQVQMNDRAEARRQGLALGNNRTQLLLQALQRNIGTITVAKCGQCSGLCRCTYQDVNDFLLVLLIVNCACLNVHLASLIVDRCSCLFVDTIERFINMQIALLNVPWH